MTDDNKQSEKNKIVRYQGYTYENPIYHCIVKVMIYRGGSSCIYVKGPFKTEKKMNEEIERIEETFSRFAEVKLISAHLTDEVSGVTMAFEI